MRVEVSPGHQRRPGSMAGGCGSRRPAGVPLWTPAYMHAGTERPAGLSGFSLISQNGVEVRLRAPAGSAPGVPETGVRAGAEAYWDGSLVAL
jgi:hypothetical protein